MKVEFSLYLAITNNHYFDILDPYNPNPKRVKLRGVRVQIFRLWFVRFWVHAKSIRSAFIFACTNRDLSLPFYSYWVWVRLFETTGQDRSSLTTVETIIRLKCFFDRWKWRSALSCSVWNSNLIPAIFWIAHNLCNRAPKSVALFLV